MRSGRGTAEVWNELGDHQAPYPEFVEVGKSRELTSSETGEHPRGNVIRRGSFYVELPSRREQTEPMLVEGNLLSKWSARTMRMRWRCGTEAM